jgi:hypothetical protein
MFSKSLMKHFNGFGSGFTELHAKPDADTLLNFPIHRKKKKKYKTRSSKRTHVKTMHVHSVVSHGRLMQ